MKDHDTDNDFLDDLYSNSAKEVPPIELDQAILKQAHDNVHKRSFVWRSQWQQLFSVAAVMVLSVYFVFDVGDQSLNLEIYESNSSSDDLSISGKEALLIPKNLSSDIFSNAIKEQPVEINSYKLEEKIETKREIKSVRRALSAPVSDDAESLMATADEMVEEIEKLIVEGKLVEANKIYEELSDTYPKYQVPIRIVEALK
ncbi:MAG: hypothetical protein JKX82_02375 [Oleispira sp.]|nr:hypothetical protein [Oleispira sp.]